MRILVKACMWNHACKKLAFACGYNMAQVADACYVFVCVCVLILNNIKNKHLVLILHIYVSPGHN